MIGRIASVNLDDEVDAAVSSESLAGTRTDHPCTHNRKENPMSLDNAVSRMPSAPCTLTSPTDEDDGLFPLPASTARVESRPAYRSAEPESVRTGWSPDSRSRLDDVSRRSSSGGGTFRTTSRRLRSTTVFNSDGSRRHLEVLEEAGLTRRMIARSAKVSLKALSTISSQTQKSIDASVAQRVLAVTFHPSDDRKRTPGVGAQRRIRALVAMGFPFSALAQRLGVSQAVLESLPEKGLIRVALWESIDRLYDELSMTSEAPNPAVRDWARDVQGWAPPLAWDDDEIDDYRARPHRPRGLKSLDPVAVERRLNGERSINLTLADQEAIVKVALSQKWPVARLADVLSCDERAANTRLVRYRSRMRTKSAAHGESVSDVA